MPYGHERLRRQDQKGAETREAVTGGERGSQRDELSQQPTYNQPKQQQTCTTDLYGKRTCY